MAADLTVILEGNVAATESKLQSAGLDYTVPTGRELIITEIRINNIMTDTPVDKWALLKVGDGTTKTVIFPKTIIEADANTNLGYIQFCQTVVKAGKSLYGIAETADCISVYITALERDV